MTAPPPRRPWWKKKRTWASGVLWLMLPVAYLLSMGPAVYAHERGWLPLRAIRVAYAPAIMWRDNRMPVIGPAQDSFRDYVAAWRAKGWSDSRSL